MAMIYPELVAALGHIDSNWPGVRYGRVEVDYQTVEPMRIALEKQQERQIDMPVWYTSGPGRHLLRCAVDARSSISMISGNSLTA